jgi:hypothetical protein
LLFGPSCFEDTEFRYQCWKMWRRGVCLNIT